MGKEIEKIAQEKGHEVVLIIDSEEDWEQHSDFVKYADVALEFTIPSKVIDNIKRCFQSGIPVVSGTTGWLDRYDEIEAECNALNQSLFYASNFSVSVNIFFEVNKYLAKHMNGFGEYDVNIEEIHHVTKIDAPSGTAIVLANDIISNLDRMEKWSEQVSNHGEIAIKSIREENVPGTHVVSYESPHDSIEIRHTAKSRRGFVHGAILAAEFLHDKKGVFSMKDLLNLR